MRFQLFEGGFPMLYFAWATSNTSSQPQIRFYINISFMHKHSSNKRFFFMKSFGLYFNTFIFYHKPNKRDTTILGTYTFSSWNKFKEDLQVMEDGSIWVMVEIDHDFFIFIRTSSVSFPKTYIQAISKEQGKWICFF